MHSRLTAKGYTDEELKAAFLCGISQKGHPYDVFRNRVIFPIFDLNGEVVAFAGRRLNEKGERKYVNTSDTPAFKMCIRDRVSAISNSTNSAFPAA